MALRPPTTPSRAQAAVRPVYEDFRPISEWKQEDDADILLIYLPGFLKEQLKVTTEGRNIIRCRGERLVAGNKWNRFQEDFHVPENCNMKGIRAKFESGILTVTMPRNRPTQVGHEGEVKTTQEAPRPLKDIHPKVAPAADTKAKMNDKNVQSLSTPNITALLGGDKQTNGKPSSPHKVTSEPKTIVQQTIGSKERSETKGKHHIESVMSEDAVKKSVEPINTGDAIKKAAEKTEDGAFGGNEENVGDKYLEAKAKQNTYFTAPGGELDKQIVEGHAKGLNQERQLMMVNMGVAVLVLVALGAYVSYTFSSSAKPNP